MSREKKRGQKLTRWKNLQSILHNDDKEYTIGLENLQEAVFTPGSAKECFSLDKYKGELVKVFKRITISLYCYDFDRIHLVLVMVMILMMTRHHLKPQ